VSSNVMYYLVQYCMYIQLIISLSVVNGRSGGCDHVLVYFVVTCKLFWHKAYTFILSYDYASFIYGVMCL
jgi:hypothetical protein